MSVIALTRPPVGPDHGSAAVVGWFEADESLEQRSSAYRMMIFGSQSVAGRGHVSHDPVFSGCLARLVGRDLGHSIDFDSVAADGPGVAKMDQAVAASPIELADSVVLVLEADASGVSVTDRGAAVHRLLAATRARMANGAMLIAAVVIPAGPTDAAALSFLDTVRAAAWQIATVIELDAPSEGDGAAALAGHIGWAKQIIDPLLADLPSASSWWRDSATSDHESATSSERVRSRSARRLGAVSPVAARALQRTVESAKVAFGTHSAGLTLIFGEHATFIVSTNVDIVDRPRAQTVCNTALHAVDGLVVPDARADARFQQLDTVLSGDVGFYAGFRVLSPGGLPVGVLCVFDPEARHHDEVELLESFAMEAERILWRDCDSAGWSGRDVLAEVA